MFNDRSFGYLLTMMSGILWGLSTPFMKQHSGHLAWNVRSSQNILSNVWPIIKMLSSNWKVGIFFQIHSQNISNYMVTFMALNSLSHSFSSINLAQFYIRIHCPIHRSMLPYHLAIQSI